MSGGKYDRIAKLALLTAEAEVAIVMIINGNNGNGFSVSLQPGRRPPSEWEACLPKLLRRMADLMENSNVTDYPRPD